jgi:hypothetical protein
MVIRILSLLESFDAPVPMERVRHLEAELASYLISESRREGIPSCCRVDFAQVPFASVGQAAADVREACRLGCVVVLAPAEVSSGKALSSAIAGLPTVVLHQNLDPADAPHPRAFRLGIGTREHKGGAAAGLLAARGTTVAAFVGDGAPVHAISRLPGLVMVEPPADPDGAATCAARILEALPPGGTVLLECGGARNRAIAHALAGRADVLFLNGNPDVRDAVAAERLVELVGNLPERIGGGLAAAVAAVADPVSQADLDAAGMIAWRIDAVRLVLEAADRVQARDPMATAEAIAAWIAGCDGKQRIVRGWHRPIWFDAGRRNACVEAVAARVDVAAGRRVTDRRQVGLGPDGRFAVVPSLAVDVDIVEVGRIDEAAGTFDAEAVVRIDSDVPWDDAGGAPACLRILNPVGDPTWIPAPGHGPRSYVLRGTFRFEPDLVAYPLDVQLLAVRVAASGAHAPAVVRAIPRSADIDCACAGWRVVGGHRGVGYAVRPAPDGRPVAVQGVEFGLRLRRARRDVQLRVALPLALLVAVAAGALLAGGADHAEMVAGILASLFLSAVALYFAEPKPSAGSRTVIDAIYARAFVLFAVLLFGVLLSMRLPGEAYAIAVTAMAAALPFACIGLLLSIRPAVGRWRWRAMRRH